MTTEKPKKSATKKPRKKPAPPMSKEDVNFIVDNIVNMSYSEIAEQRGITTHQVNRVRNSIVNDLRKATKDDPDKAKQIEQYINTKLSRPEETRVGSKGAGQVSKAIANTVDNILGNVENILDRLSEKTIT